MTRATAVGATGGRRLSDDQRLAWLRLIRSENVGPITFRDLVNQYGGATAALEALPEIARRSGRGRSYRACGRAEAEAELASARQSGAELVAMGEPGYPTLLAALEAPPPVLYVKGRKELAERPAIAIVGARDASAAGRKLTRMLAADLGREGVAIVSGLARGIDAAAHEEALATGTIGVVAGGIDVVYPPEHAALQAAIARDGLLIAESAPGLEPRGRDFPRRNRIISGIAYGVLVVEAAKRSGSRITANFALEQNREVFAVPGNPLDPRAEGTNGLLKSGATLVTEAADILRVLAPLVGRPPPQPALPLTEIEPMAGINGPPGADERTRLIAALGPAPVEVDTLARETGVPIYRVRALLIELDIAGRIERHAGDRVSLLT
jgi:DNA processing protein